jgi:methylenetetrahydrofolate dehydrogenase (NADP+)/methenyltetrahydrofolate cyclohydrolase
VIIGASKIVGMPLSLLMLNKGATVTTCHIKTRDYRQYTKNADIVVVATGNPQMVKKEDLKKGAIIIDVGINKIVSKNKKRKIVGDVDFENVKDHVSAITPVPGGVGPMTISAVLENTFELFKRQIINDHGEI